MTMQATDGWLLDAHTVLVVLSIWAAAVLVYGFWRSLGSAAADPIRDSGPIL
jgi:hypothetical protein